eukprot:6185364-Pleurochrysis_carterae.AAC.1
MVVQVHEHTARVGEQQRRGTVYSAAQHADGVGNVGACLPSCRPSSAGPAPRRVLAGPPKRGHARRGKGKVYAVGRVATFRLTIQCISIVTAVVYVASFGSDVEVEQQIQDGALVEYHRFDSSSDKVGPTPHWIRR